MNNTQKFELRLEEPWTWEYLEPPEDPLGELSELENNLRQFCFECNHKVALKIGDDSEELFLDPDIILILNELPEQMSHLSLGKKIEINFPESWIILKFVPSDDEISCTFKEFGNSCIIKEYQLDITQVLQMFEGFIDELMQMAIAGGYITFEEKYQFLRGWNSMPEITAFDVASYLINVFNKLSKKIDDLILQKLLYYAQAWYLAIYDKPLFEEPIEAWSHGPVQPQVYKDFKRFYSNQINPRIREVKLPMQIELHLNNIIKLYGNYDGVKLKRMTHQEEPWKQARGDTPEDQRSNAVISQESMRIFYRNLLDEREYSVFKMGFNSNTKMLNYVKLTTLN